MIGAGSGEARRLAKRPPCCEANLAAAAAAGESFLRRRGTRTRRLASASAASAVDTTVYHPLTGRWRPPARRWFTSGAAVRQGPIGRSTCRSGRRGTGRSPHDNLSHLERSPLRPSRRRCLLIFVRPVYSKQNSLAVCIRLANYRSLPLHSVAVRANSRLFRLRLGFQRQNESLISFANKIRKTGMKCDNYNTIPLRFDGRSTAYQRSLRSQ